MINFSNLEFKRLIMHQIVAKQPGQDYASVVYETSLFTIDDNVKNTLKERLVDAAGKTSRAFELEITDFSTGTFFDYAHNVKSLNDTEFVESSKSIADLLAFSQKRNNIPGGYLLLIDCFNNSSTSSVYIAIKAELHKALKFEKHDGVSQIEVLSDVFLSPSQKLYKIGILCERTESTLTFPNDSFSCFVFDEQFRVDGKPAEYFYSDFLGFSVDKNAKIQSKRFYDYTYNFILDKIDNSSNKGELIKALKLEFTVNQENIITPRDFCIKYFENTDIRDSYLSHVASQLPSSIVKDSSLIELQLSKKKINFPDNINIVGPDQQIDQNVNIITSESDFNLLNFNDTSYSIIRIKGKPFSNE